MEFSIRHTWDSSPVDHEPVRVRFSAADEGVKMEVSAPFFNDPPPPQAPPTQPCPQLWNYEVVEAFFLNSRTEQYLEVELCPHGQHLVLLLEGKRNVLMQQLPLSFVAVVTGASWKGEGLIPWRYFPAGVDKMNAYAIHSSGGGKTYEALYTPTNLQEGAGPDFHRLECFQPFSLQCIMGADWLQPESDLWKKP